MAGFLERIQAGLRAFNNPVIQPILAPNVGEKSKDYPIPLVWNMISPGRGQWHLIDYEAYAKEGFSQNEIIYACIKYKWDSLSQAPLRAYKGNRYDAEILDEPENPLSVLALRPNKYMGATQFMQYNILYLNLHGNSFVYFNNKEPYSLIPLRPDRVQIVPDANKDIMGYLYYPDGVTSEKAFPIKTEQMLHVKFPNPYDLLEGLGYGLSPLAAGARTADTDNRMTNFLSEFFARNGIMGGGTIELPYDADIEDIARLREQFLDTYGGADKWGKPIVIDAGGKYVPQMVDFTHMELDNIDLRNMRRIGAVFGVSARMLGLDSSASTDNNMQTDENAFWTRVMITELRMFEDELAAKVRIKDGEFLRFDVSAIPAFSEDVTQQVSNYVQLVSHFVSPNAAAEIVGLRIPPMEGGEESYLPTTLQPVKLALNPPKPEPLGGFGAEGEGGEQGQEEGETAPEKPKEEETPKEAEASKAVRKAFKRLSFETKDAMANSQVRIALSYEPKLAETARKQFGKDLTEIMKLFDKAKKANRKARKSFDWNDFENSVRFYLFLQGQQEWSWEFAVWFVELAWDARDDYIESLKLRQAFPTIDFDAIFLSRASIEGEAWFANYRLQFARSITRTTEEGIHAVIRDGLDAGYGTDKIGKKIELLFDQYMSGGTAPEDWDFMQERMPAYRTEMIARTETHGAMNAGNHYFFKRTGATHHEWWAVGDDRVRDSHLQAWNVYSEGGSIGPIPLDVKFVVGGAEMAHPGDKSAPLAQVINCRCAELPYYPQED